MTPLARVRGLVLIRATQAVAGNLFDRWVVSWDEDAERISHARLELSPVLCTIVEPLGWRVTRDGWMFDTEEQAPCSV